MLEGVLSPGAFWPAHRPSKESAARAVLKDGRGQADELRMAAAEAGDWDESPVPGMDSPDERFPTKEAYEAALERMEMEGIARAEGEDNA